jgi:hypothetical protein
MPIHEDDDEAEDWESRKARRRRERREAAALRVQIPEWMLMAAGLGGGLLMMAWITFNLLVNLGVVRSIGGPPIPMGMDRTVAIAGFLFWTVVTALWSGFVTAGGICMVRRRVYGLAVAGCIIALFPCNCGCMLGLPIGIWGLVVLFQKDVQRTFGF